MFPIAVWLLSFLAPGVQRCGNSVETIASNTVFKWSCIKVAFAVTVVFAPKLTTYYSWQKEIRRHEATNSFGPSQYSRCKTPRLRMEIEASVATLFLPPVEATDAS